MPWASTGHVVGGRRKAFSRRMSPFHICISICFTLIERGAYSHDIWSLFHLCNTRDGLNAVQPSMLRTNGARSRLGCLSCRRRKKKCDEVKPTCTACLRNDLRCVWQDLNPSTRNLAAGSTLQQQRAPNATALVPASNAWALAPSSAHRNLPIATIPASPSPFVIPGSVLSGSETWRLLDHYLKDTANRLACLQDSANPFLNTLLPVALGDELLMNSILALSGVHLMQRLPELNSELQSLTWSSYTQALKQLRIALSTAFGQGSSVDAAWRALLVVLIFYLLEVGITVPSLIFEIHDMD